MATTYLSPGVYVEEIDSGTKPIQALGSSMPAFLGITAQASKKFIQSGTPDPEGNVLNESQLVTNWTQYKQLFGGFINGAFLPDAIYGYFNNGGGACYVTSLKAVAENYDTNAEKAVCTIPVHGSAAADTPADENDEGADPTAKKIAKKDIGFVVEAKVGGSFGSNYAIAIDHELGRTKKEPQTFNMRLLFHGVLIEERLGLRLEKGKILDNGQEVVFENIGISQISGKMPAPTPRDAKDNPAPYKFDHSQKGNPIIEPLTAKEIIGDSAARTGLGGLEALDDIRLIVCPDLMAGLPLDGTRSKEDDERIISVQKAMDAQCQRLKYRFAILDTPPGLNAQEVKAWRNKLGIDSSYAALYYPWLKVADLSGSNGRSKFIPPSGILAGVYNRVDGSRGVHKAPANEVPLGVIDLQYSLTQGEQDTLNPNGINCLRPFPGGRGIKVWGARTLSTEGAWRYINVRRLFITVAASLDAGLQWVVFEPNDRALWARVRRDINAFLSTFWLNGALFGNSKSEAYYVKCDDELNPPAIRDLGQLIIEVGLCPVKPAEFVILRLSQWAGPNAENE